MKKIAGIFIACILALPVMADPANDNADIVISDVADEVDPDEYNGDVSTADGAEVVELVDEADVPNEEELYALFDEYHSKLVDNAEKMKAKEQSLENRLLGAAAIGATGIGAMNMMSGMAEQKADDAAEEDMRAYLATFVCDYGQGRNIKGGETNIDLPGGNDLFSQVNEYRTLAADLKARKEALGKTPGIESEIIYDISETGLYDNAGMGRQSGAYASISKALTDETGVDAARWAEQKSDTSSKVKTGAITAGIGAVGGAAGNVIINSENSDQSQQINIDYKEKLKTLGMGNE